VLLLAVAVAVFPVPVIAVVLLLGSDHGTTKGLAFVLAWCAGLAAVGAVVLALAGIADANNDGEPTTWVNVLLLGLGLVLVALAVKQSLGRPRGDEEAPMPGWMQKVVPPLSSQTPSFHGRVAHAVSPGRESRR
jgi:hypothetical protein